MRDKNFKRRSERGSALVYILIAIALLGALTVSFMDNSSNQTGSQNTFKAVSELQSQIDFIRSAVHECRLVYTKGDPREPRSGGPYVSGIPNNLGESDEGASHFYPINPNSTYFATATLGQAGGREVKNIRCPGNPGDDVNHEPIFGGRSGKFLPPIPNLFEDWQWYNGTDGVFFWTETTRSDAFIDSVFEKLDAEFSACEADIIDSTGGADTLDSGATVQCPAGSKCFRVWMVVDNVAGADPVESGIQDANVAVFPDEVGCP